MSTGVRVGAIVGAAGCAAAVVVAHLNAPQVPLWPLLVVPVALASWAAGWAGGLAAAALVGALPALAESGFRAPTTAAWIEWAWTASAMAVAACAMRLGLGAAERWRGLHDRAVEALVGGIGGRYAWSVGRSARVADYAVAIGRRLGIRGRRARNLRLAALLHDVGTLGVSPQVMTKQGALSGPQRMEIEVHPAAGVTLLAPIGYDREVLEAVRHHHERSDGTGYPSGLSGKQTPLLARIVAVADAFEALTHERPYRPALAASEAVDLLRGGAYWPQVVDALYQALDRGEIVAGSRAAARDARGVSRDPAVMPRSS
jgi:hypothetical protein